MGRKKKKSYQEEKEEEEDLITDERMAKTLSQAAKLLQDFRASSDEGSIFVPEFF